MQLQISTLTLRFIINRGDQNKRGGGVGWGQNINEKRNKLDYPTGRCNTVVSSIRSLTEIK